MFRPLTVLTRNRRIAFIIAAIVCVAGVSVSWYVMHENKQETTTKIPTLSFHKVLPPPNQPILATSYFVSNGTVLSDSQPGVIYASQWYKDDGNPVVKTNHTAVWPKPVNVKGANQVIVKFDTTVMPDIVIVNVYNRLQKNGGPVGKPTYSCATVQGQDSKSCELYTSTEDKLHTYLAFTLRGEKDTSTNDYIAIQAYWNVPAHSPKELKKSLTMKDAEEWLFAISV